MKINTCKSVDEFVDGCTKLDLHVQEEGSIYRAFSDEEYMGAFNIETGEGFLLEEKMVKPCGCIKSQNSK